MKKITQKILLCISFGLLAVSMNAQTTYHNDFRFENEVRGFTVQKVSLNGQDPNQVGLRVNDIVDGADSSPVFTETRSSLTIPDGLTRDQRAISFKNVSGDSPGIVNHEIEAWALMTNQDLSSLNSPKVSFWTQQRFMIGSGSTLTVWVSENYTHGSVPSTATWTNETANITGAIATSGVSPQTYVYGELDLSAYNSASVTVAFKIVTDNSAYVTDVNQHGTFYISDVKFEATFLNVMPGSFSALNTSATGQTAIFNTPTAASSNANFTNTATWANVLTTATSTPRLITNVTIPAGEGYKFEVSSMYNPIVVTEVFYKLMNPSAITNGQVASSWIVQGSNDNSTWDNLSSPKRMFTTNSGADVAEYPNYIIPLTSTKPYRYYRFVLSEPWISTSGFTNLREIDFKVAALWQGTSNTDWSTGTNWNTAVVPTNEVVIPSGLTNFPTIPTGTAVTTNNISIESGATLVTQGTSTVSGNVTYKRNITHTSGNLEGWHLIGAPVTGQNYGDTYVTDNSIASSSGTNRGIATYNNAVASGNWTYLQAAGNGTFTKGMGYSVKTSTTRGISFTGSLHTSDPELVGITVGTGTAFNLISNPFAAFVNAKTFLDVTANAEKLTSKTIWVWNPTTKNYETKLAGDPQEFLIAPGQGFFVSCSTAGNLEFAKSNQVHSGTETFLKSAPVTEIVLKMNADNDERFAKIRYQNEATTSFDNGYDGETFSGVANSLDVFTQLIENTTDKKYQIQAIPNSNYENMVVPVGVVSSSSKEITFTADGNNIPNGYQVYLEDRTNNVVTLLSDANTSYKTTVESGDSLGRFFVHMKTSSVLRSETTELSGITIYTSNNDLKIIGLNQGKTTISLHSILGKKVLATLLNATGNNSIKLPNLAKGIYVVTLQTKNKEVNKKIIIE